MQTEDATNQNQAQLAWAMRMVGFWRELVAANQKKLDDANLDDIARQVLTEDLEFNQQLLAAAEKDVEIAKGASEAVDEFEDDEPTMPREVSKPAAEHVVAAVPTHEPDEDNRAFCGRVGVPMAKHAATCPECHDKVLDLSVRALGAIPRHGWSGEKKFYQFSLPDDMERFGLVCQTLPRASLKQACQDALRTIGEWCLRQAGG